MYEVRKPTYQRAETELSPREYLGDNFVLELADGNVVVGGDVDISTPGLVENIERPNVNNEFLHKVTYRGVTYEVTVDPYDGPYLYWDEDEDDFELEEEIFKILGL